MRRISVWLWLLLAASVAAEFLFHAAPESDVPWYHRMPAFHALYGLAGCAAIVWVSKWLGKAFLQAPESDEEREEAAP